MSMPAYKTFLIQQQTYDGSTYTDVGQTVDTYIAYKVVCQECPFKYLPEVKEPAKRDWFDEDGEDSYIPATGLRMKAYDMEVKFLYVGTEQDMHDDLKDFIDFIYGKNTNGSPCLAVYDDYTKTGRRGVYTSEVSNELLIYNDSDTDVVAQFKVKFRVTDPVTDIDLSGGMIT